METAEKTLMDMISVQDYCTTPLFMEEKVPVKSPQELSKKKADLQETESFYMDVSHPPRFSFVWGRIGYVAFNSLGHIVMR